MLLPNILEYSVTNPFRPPDCRFRRAMRLAADPAADITGEDKPTQVAVDLLRRLEPPDTDTAWRTIFMSDPATTMALELCRRPASAAALELKMRILAGQLPNTIARLTGHTTSTVVRYEQLAFDVVDRRHARDYVIHHVVRLHEGPITTRKLAQMSAYVRGPLIIDGWLDYLEHACEEHDLNTPEGRRRQSVHLLVLAHRVNEDERNTTRLKGLSPILDDLTLLQEPSRAVSDVLAAEVERGLDDLDWAPAESWEDVRMQMARIAGVLSMQNGTARPTEPHLRAGWGWSTLGSETSAIEIAQTDAREGQHAVAIEIAQTDAREGQHAVGTSTRDESQVSLQDDHGTGGLPEAVRRSRRLPPGPHHRRHRRGPESEAAGGRRARAC